MIGLEIITVRSRNLTEKKWYLSHLNAFWQKVNRSSLAKYSGRKFEFVFSLL